ncbi:AAA-ATPase At3g28510-like [Syzygium oleosum]|uniref:AAA-ATPase At3g28510-like n=1 Tax=Syzygium oleosum TaxID=219896 RepID=UPI0011D1A92A|nr:AAA-ATPase At3g28510-like [Syzygium oleosum]XP_056169687.1 AAA-ATPase At3g28510-like [Syzygium oleosum]
MMFPAEMFAHYGSTIGGLVVLRAMVQQYLPSQLRDFVDRYIHKWMSLFDNHVQISFPQFTGQRMKSSEAYMAIQNYLIKNVTSVAKKLKADSVKDSRSLVLSMDDFEEVTDEYKGAKVRWILNKVSPQSSSVSMYAATEPPRYYTLTFNRKNRELIMQSYIRHVLIEGKAIASTNRQRKLYTNDPLYSMWNHVVFEHPATFETLAMDPDKKREIMNDLTKFTQRKEYYAKIGKAWKRGYLLYGPPGTGKSTMVAAMANFLKYDVYDLELTAVKNNTELRRLLIEISSKSIIVIEDIDCSLDLTGQRKKEGDDENDDGGEDKSPAKKLTQKEKKSSEVTLSGLLNFIDGIWSACGGERIIVFTTNHLDKLDPALIRRGRMDKHIEMSYCCYEAFKVLARNYLNIDDHPLYKTIGGLFDNTNMTPADVAENLMPKSDDEDVEVCLRNLIQALEAVKEKAKKNAEEEAQAKVERERQEKRSKWWRESKKWVGSLLKKKG